MLYIIIVIIIIVIVIKWTTPTSWWIKLQKKITLRVLPQIVWKQIHFDFCKNNI